MFIDIRTEEQFFQLERKHRHDILFILFTSDVCKKCKFIEEFFQAQGNKYTFPFIQVKATKDRPFNTIFSNYLAYVPTLQIYHNNQFIQELCLHNKHCDNLKYTIQKTLRQIKQNKN